MPVYAKDILQSHAEQMRHIQGPLDIEIKGTCSQENPQAHAIVFLSNLENLNSLLNSSVNVIVVPDKAVAKMGKLTTDITILSAKNTRLAMARVNTQYFALNFLRAPFAGKALHPTAQISQSAHIASDVIIGPGAVIGENVKIGQGSFIGANSVIETNSVIGENCFIHPLVYIGHSCHIGHRCEIKPHSVIGSDGFGFAEDENGKHIRVPHYGAVIIEDDVQIGANVNVDRGTFEPARIGEGTKIDNHCHFGHNIQIGKNCIITAGMIAAGSVKIGDSCVFGGRCSINGHIEIASKTIVAGLSGINNNVTKGGMYGGYPLIGYKDSLKSLSSLSSVPRLRRNVTRIMKHLGLSSDGDLET